MATSAENQPSNQILDDSTAESCGLPELKILAFICTGLTFLIHNSSLESLDRISLILTTGTYISFLVILPALITTHFTDFYLTRFAFIYFNALGVATFLCVGLYILSIWSCQKPNRITRRQIAKGVLSLVVAGIFSGELYMIVCNC